MCSRTLRHFQNCSKFFSLSRKLSDLFWKHFKIFWKKFKIVPKHSDLICFRNILKVFRNSKMFLKSVLKHADQYSRLSYFKNVPILLIYNKTFRFVLGTLKNVLVNFQDYSQTVLDFFFLGRFKSVPEH